MASAVATNRPNHMQAHKIALCRQTRVESKCYPDIKGFVLTRNKTLPMLDERT